MMMNALIPMAGQTVDVPNALYSGARAAGAAQQVQQQNALFPVQMEQAQANVAATKAGTEFTMERLAQLRQAAKQAASDRIKAEGAERLAQETAEVEAIVSRALSMPEMADQLYASHPELREFVGQDPRAVATSYLGVKDALAATAQPKAADEYGRYVQETRARGEEPLDRIQFAQAKKGQGFSVVTPDGTRVTYGGSADTQSSPLQPSSPSSMLSTIDGILSDPALETSTGILSPLQNIPGTPQRRFGARARQLEGQAFLQAFESLKGGGQITEVEGQKATQAIGRMDTAQSPADYRAALEELRGILAAGISRPQGWAEQQRAQSDLSKPTPVDEVRTIAPATIRQMSRDDITRLPIGELGQVWSEDQWDALEQRAKELDGE